MKKCLTCLLVVVLLLQLSGCRINEKTLSDSKQIDEMSKEIVRCLIEKDREALETLFCPKVQNTVAFASQLDTLYNFFDYDHFIRYDLDGNHAESEARESGVRTEWSVDAEIIYIEVSEENGTLFYGIEYHWTPVYEADTQLVGLHSLTVRLLNSENSVTLGTDQDFPF